MQIFIDAYPCPATFIKIKRVIVTIQSRRNGERSRDDLALFVETEWLVDHLEEPHLSILDVRAQDEFENGHIPGAVRVELQEFSTTVNRVGGMALPPAPFTEKMRSLGVNQESRVILYDDHWGMPAARLLWMLTRYGHSKAAVLNGGWDRWREEGRPVTVDRSPPTPGNFTAQGENAQIAERGWILARLSAPDLLLIDTRTPAEFRQGHLPGALNWDWMTGVPIEGWLSLRPEDELRRELTALGVTPDKEIVTYCRSGARAAHTYLLLRHLGYPRVRNYDGSWLEWSRYAGAGEVTRQTEAVGEEQ